MTRYRRRSAGASSSSRRAPSASGSTSQDVGTEGPEESLPRSEDRVLRTLDVHLHDHPRSRRQEHPHRIERPERNDLTFLEAHPRRVERGECRASFARGHAHGRVGVADPFAVHHDPIGDTVAAQVRLEGVGHRGHDLERVGMEAGRDRHRREREEAGVGADVEELIGLARERRDRVERQTVVRLRAPAAPPEELLRVLASSRVEHHERRAADPPLDFSLVRR